MAERRKGFPSPYRATYERGWELKNLGHDYEATLLRKSMSSYMFKNPTIASFLEDYLQPILVAYINAVKYIRVYYNFAVPKWYQKIN